MDAPTKQSVVIKIKNLIMLFFLHKHVNFMLPTIHTV